MAYLKWVEPWGGYDAKEDTGFCNRLFHWELAYYLNDINNYLSTKIIKYLLVSIDLLKK